MPILDNHVIERLQIRSRPRKAYLAGDVLKRAQALLPEEKLLVELAVKNELSFPQLAKIFKVDAGTVCRRLKRVTRRLNDPLVVLLLDPVCPLPQEYRLIGIEHFLQGKSSIELADLHQVRVCEVRRMLEHIRGCFRGVNWRRG